MLVSNLKSVEPGQWVSNHADYLYSFAIARINDEDVARDLVQETFLAALERLDKFEGRSSERTWLTSILKHKLVDVYRKKSSLFVSPPHTADDFFEEDNGHWKEAHAPKAFGIEDYDQMAAKELQKVLRQCLEKLPALWLSVFTMKHIDELATDVICASLKVTASNFWVIIHRAKVNLRACVQNNW
jgi:RNA polymerase sigma-70 factor (ECF subfamily)